MDNKKRYALEKILCVINGCTKEERSEAISALETLVSVQDVAYVMLDKGYKLEYTSRQYLKEIIRNDAQ